MRVREDIEPQYRLADVAGEVGEVIAIEDDWSLRVCFPSSDRWRGLASELLLATGHNLQVGLKVRVRKGIRPSYGWGNAAPGQIGEVVQLQGILVIVRFPESPQWPLGNNFGGHKTPVCSELTIGGHLFHNEKISF